MFRDYRDFYVSRTDLSTGRVTNSVGQQFDLTMIENDSENKYKRRYQGVTGQATYRFGSRTDIGGTYTLSHAWGNLDGENVTSGPVTGGAYQYPEYLQESWFFPEGDLVIDQRHRTRLWINWGVPKADGLTLSLLQALESGIPYAAGGLPIQGGNANGVNVAPYIDNPGYVTEPAGSATQYFYTARDAFRTEGQKRTDFAANYTYNLGARGRTFGLFVQAQVINLFNQFQLCACGAVNVFANPGAPGTGAGLQAIDRTIRYAGQRRGEGRAVQPVHADAGRGCELVEGRGLRQGGDPICLHDAANLPAHVRRAVLGNVGRPFQRTQADPFRAAV